MPKCSARAAQPAPITPVPSRPRVFTSRIRGSRCVSRARANGCGGDAFCHNHNITRAHASFRRCALSRCAALFGADRAQSWASAPLKRRPAAWRDGGRGRRRVARRHARGTCVAPRPARDSGRPRPRPRCQTGMCGASTMPSPRLRLQVGDHIAEDTLPISLRPDRSAYSSALTAGLLPSMSRPTSCRRGPRRCSSSSARRPVKWPLPKSTSQPSPSSNGERALPTRECPFGGDEVDVRRQEAGLDPRQVQRARADRPDAARPAVRHQRIPQAQRLVRRDPQLVAEVAGEAGARDRHSQSVRREVADLERLQLLDTGEPELPQDRAGRRPLQRQRGDLLGHLD